MTIDLTFFLPTIVCSLGLFTCSPILAVLCLTLPWGAGPTAASPGRRISRWPGATVEPGFQPSSGQRTHNKRLEGRRRGELGRSPLTLWPGSRSGTTSVCPVALTRPEWASHAPAWPQASRPQAPLLLPPRPGLAAPLTPTGYFHHLCN